MSAVQTHLFHGRRLMKEWANSNFDNSRVWPILDKALADMLLKYQTISNPVTMLQDGNPAVCCAPVLEHFNFTISRDNIDPLSDRWRAFIIKRYMDGFSVGTVDDSYVSLPLGEIGTMFKTPIMERQLDTYARRAGRSTPDSLYYLLILIKLWRQVLAAKLSAALSVDQDPVSRSFEMRYDALVVYFQRVNELAKELLQTLIHGESPNPSFPLIWQSWILYSSAAFTAATGRSDLKHFDFSRHSERDLKAPVLLT